MLANLDAAPQGAADPGVGAPGAVAAEQAAATPTQTPSVGATDEQDGWELLKTQYSQLNVKPEQLAHAFSLAHHLATPEGKRDLFSELTAEFGQSYFDQQLAERLSTSRGKRHLRRAIDRMDGVGGAGDEQAAVFSEYSEAPQANPANAALLDVVESLKQELAEVKKQAQLGTKIASETGEALARDAEYQALARRNELAMKLYPDMVAEANDLMRRYPAKYAGPGGPTRAAADFLKTFEARSSRAGFQRQGGSTQLPKGGGGETISTKPPDVSKMSALEKADAIVKWMNENPGA